MVKHQLIDYGLYSLQIVLLSSLEVFFKKISGNSEKNWHAGIMTFTPFQNVYLKSYVKRTRALSLIHFFASRFQLKRVFSGAP